VRKKSRIYKKGINVANLLDSSDKTWFNLRTKRALKGELGVRNFPWRLKPVLEKRSACLSFEPELPKTANEFERVLGLVLILH